MSRTKYDYDDTDQLTSATHSFQTDESYSYDANGNRTNTGYQTDPNNRLAQDGTFTYDYDHEGNRTLRTRISGAQADDYTTEYTWDHRNRLTKVTFKNNQGTVTKVVEYTYDVWDRRIGRRVDADGNGTFEIDERFVYDGAHIALEFDGAGSLTHRYLYGPAVDQILADEDAAGDVLWPLTDNLGTVRDLVDSTGTVVNHIQYDSFGNITAETDPSTGQPPTQGSILDGDFLFAYTGREWDADVELYFYRARYYDPDSGRFVSEDPIGFVAGDANLSRYVGNSPQGRVDPSGLQSPLPSKIDSWAFWGNAASQLDISGSMDARRVRAALAQLDRGFSLDEIPTTVAGRTAPAFRPITRDQSFVTRSLKDGFATYRPRATPAQTARLSIRVNLRYLKQQIVDKVYALLKANPPKGTTPKDWAEAANAFADAYIRAVDEFLKTHPGAKPALGERSRLLNWLGIQNARNAPWCADWAIGVNNGIADTFPDNRAVRDTLMIRLGQWNRGRRTQQNYVVVWPRGHKPRVRPVVDPGILILDPWFDLMPRIYEPTPQNAPTHIGNDLITD